MCILLFSNASYDVLPFFGLKADLATFHYPRTCVGDPTFYSGPMAAAAATDNVNDITWNDNITQFSSYSSYPFLHSLPW